MQEFPSLILKTGRERSVIRRHPWIFSGGVKNHPQAPEGAIVEVRDRAGSRLGYGHYAPASNIICRMFAFGQGEVTPDEGYWRDKFRRSLSYRKSFLDMGSTTGYRLINSEGDGLPGMIVDLYGDAASLQLRTRGAAALAPVLETFLKEECGVNSVFKSLEEKGKHEINEEESPGAVKRGWEEAPQSELLFTENGHRFKADIEKGQKTGFFLDQRDNRALLGAFSRDRTVLNAFSYSGAFSVYALAGGAREVISVDSSDRANELCREHILLNFRHPVPHEAISADCFQYLKEMPSDHFDLIILDPPAFTKHISTVTRASRGYKEINLKALQKIKKGGMLFTFSCSQHISTDLFRKIIFGAATDSGRDVRVVNQLSQAPDHPISIYHPEGEYLKGLQLYVE